jgi:hypothetical protein
LHPGLNKLLTPSRKEPEKRQTIAVVPLLVKGENGVSANDQADSCETPADPAYVQQE